MSKNNPDTFDSVIKWLEKQGYPLEMSVARRFQKADFYVKISDFYKDFETEKPREIDITAQYHSDALAPVFFQVSFHIECKSSPGKPWILFVSDTSRGELGFPSEKFVSSEIYRMFLAMMLDSKHREKFYPKFNSCPLLKLPNVSYGITQAFTNGQDIPFSAVMSAVKSSISRIQMFEDLSLPVSKKFQCAAAFPVVVFDGTLLESRMNENGEIQLAEVESGTLYWKFPNPINSTPFVFVVTKNSLSDFVEKASVTAKTLIDLVSDFMPKLTEVAEGLSQIKKTA